MQPIFSNTCKYTLDNLKQVTKADLPMWYKAYCIIFAAVFGVIAIVAFFMTHSPKSAIFLLFSITLLMIYYHKTALTARKHYEQSKALHGDIAVTKLFFYNNSIVGKNMFTGQSFKAEYEKVNKIVETKNLYILRILDDISIVVDKNGFVSDNGSKFPEFIKQKCKNAKLPKNM